MRSYTQAQLEAMLDTYLKTSILFQDESKWCQGWSARNAQGDACYFASLEARCFCIDGAFRLFGAPEDAFDFSHQLALELFGEYLHSKVNDEHGLEAVRKLLATLIERTEATLTVMRTV